MSFFNKHPVLYPWPLVLRRSGLKIVYKPREVWWKEWLRKLELKPGDKVLEVGCGRGVFLDRLVTEYGIKATGIDIAKKAVTEGEKESVNKLDLRVADAAKLPFPDAFFDVVMSFDTLEHVKDQEKAITEMMRVLKPKGKILIYTINKKQRFTWNWLLSKVGIDVLKRSDHDPKFFVAPDRFKKELERRGVKMLGLAYFNSFFSLAIDEVIMVFLSFWQRLLGWEKTENFGKIILKALTIFSIVLTPILRALELPWTVFGHSNDFLVLGSKR